MKRIIAAVAALLITNSAFADNLGSAVGGQAANQSGMAGGVYQTSPTVLTNGQQAGFAIDPTTHAMVTVPASGGPATTVNQGTAAAVSGGWPTTNGEPADTTGTFTNATQTGNVTTASVDGYAAAIISIHGTYNTATATFQASDDAGTTFYPVACNRIDGSNAPELGYTALTNVNRAWLCATQGFDQIQVLSSAVTSGTVSVRISQSAAPIQAPAQQTTAPGARTIVALDVSTVTTGGTAVTALIAGHRTAGGFLYNPIGATINLCINEQAVASGTTSAAGLTCIQPGQSYTLVPSSLAVSVITSDSSHPFSGEGLN